MHVVVLAGVGDAFDKKFSQRTEKLVVPFGIEGHKEAANINVYSELSEYQLEVDPTADEFFQLATAAYTADVRTSRRESFDGWTREFFLWMPVRSPKKWAAIKEHLERALEFLTGDKWRIEFRRRSESYEVPAPAQRSLKIPLSVDCVSLFSGGLDSYVGAIDLINSKRKPLLIGHHSLGGGATSASQKNALSVICMRYAETHIPFLHLWVSPKKGEGRASEITTRGRSILFLALGVVCATSAGVEELFIPENGFISLNVPLTPTRLGSFSTRTTHPYFIFLLQQCFNNLGIGVKLKLPYRYQTKGEMIERCLDQTAVNDAIRATMSCSHPGIGRWSGETPNAHCGYCVPCIIRRAAISASRKDKTKYRFKPSRSLSVQRALDYKSFRMAIDRANSEGISVLDIMASGPIPPESSRDEHLGVYKRGLAEVAKVLDIKLKFK